MPYAERIGNLPTGLVVFKHDGSAQFGWFNPETSEYCAEVDGRRISDVAGAVDWVAAYIH